MSKLFKKSTKQPIKVFWMPKYSSNSQNYDFFAMSKNISKTFFSKIADNFFFEISHRTQFWSNLDAESLKEPYWAIV